MIGFINHIKRNETMEKKMRKNILLTLLIVLTVSTYAKGGNEQSKSVDVSETKEFTFPFNGEDRTITLPSNPERIVVIGYDTLDIVDALGFKDRVVGVADPKGPLFPSYLEGYENIPSIGAFWGNDLEAVASVKPDLIIASARTFNSFDALSEIAPAVYFTIPGMGSPYKERLYENISNLSYILGIEAKGDELIKKLDNKINDVKDNINKLNNPSALFLIITGKTIGLYSDDVKSRYGFVFNEFDFSSVATAEEIKNDSAQHGESVSFEFISAKQPEFLLVIDRGASTGESDITAKDTLDNVLVAETPAAKNNKIIYLDPTSWYISNGGFTSTNVMLDNLLSNL